jgi:integrase
MLEYLAPKRSPASHAVPNGALIATLLLQFRQFAAEYYQKNGKPTTELGAYDLVIKSVSRLYGTSSVADFGPLALKAVRQAWLDAGLSRSTINRNQRRLVRIFRWGVEEEMVDPAIWQALSAVQTLKKGRTTAAEPQPVPPVELDRVHATMEHLSPVLCAMIRLQLLTGMRPGEVCALRPIDIDRSNDVWVYRPLGHKTEHHNRSRTIYIGPQAQAVLTPFLFRDPTSHCFSAAESKEWYRQQASEQRKTPDSCGNVRGRRSGGFAKRKSTSRNPRAYFDSGSYGKGVADGCQKAWPAPDAIKGDADAVKAWHKRHRWSPNQLRHTRATEVRKKYGLEAAQVILGHASADVTQIYAERDADKARQVSLEIG